MLPADPVCFLSLQPAERVFGFIVKLIKVDCFPQVLASIATYEIMVSVNIIIAGAVLGCVSGYIIHLCEDNRTE